MRGHRGGRRGFVVYLVFVRVEGGDAGAVWCEEADFETVADQDAGGAGGSHELAADRGPA